MDIFSKVFFQNRSDTDLKNRFRKMIKEQIYGHVENIIQDTQPT
jgi:hypothetical protein